MGSVGAPPGSGQGQRAATPNSPAEERRRAMRQGGEVHRARELGLQVAFGEDASGFAIDLGMADDHRVHARAGLPRMELELPAFVQP